MLSVHKFTEAEDGLDFFDLTSEHTEWKEYLGFELARLHGFFVVRMLEYCDHYFGIGRTPDLALAQLTANI